jgi:Fe-S oxidoreductase
VNLAVYLTRPEVRAFGRVGVVALPATSRALNVLEQEAQIDRGAIVEIPVELPAGAPPPGVDELLAAAPEDRMAFWSAEFDRCVRCYACRQACPLCYCPQCIADKNRPQEIDSSPTVQGNYAWHVARAFHLAGRCVGCGECSRACPAAIPLGLLNTVLARAAVKEFGYRSGAERGVEPLVGRYRLDDREEFIR